MSAEVPSRPLASQACRSQGHPLAPRVAVPHDITGEPPALGQPVHRLSGVTMGTTWSVALVGPPGLRLAAIDAALQRVCNDVIAEMSQWTPDSILSRFNRAASGSEHALPEGFARVLSAALDIAALSEGAYDPTAGELVGLWGFGPSGMPAHGEVHAGAAVALHAETSDANPDAINAGRDAVNTGANADAGANGNADADANANANANAKVTGTTTRTSTGTGTSTWLRHDDPAFRLPTPEQRAQAHCGWQSLRWDAQRRVLTQPGRATLDLSAIAKGDAVDRLSDLLTGLGLPHHLVEVGGELRGAGLKPDGQPWWVDLEPPQSDFPLPPMRVALHGLSIATSGDYRKSYLDAHGQRLSHTVDPRQRRPVSHGLASVTVLHPSAMWADGWSTALMVLGPEDGLRLAEQQHLAARLVVRRPSGRFDEHLSSALQALLI